MNFSNYLLLIIAIGTVFILNCAGKKFLSLNEQQLKNSYFEDFIDFSNINTINKGTKIKIENDNKPGAYKSDKDGQNLKKQYRKPAVNTENIFFDYVN